ncbi:MAG: prolyl oligopeptidase family serine peptidase [Polyangiaceae bacterium]|nr:prolyl oligopeptidase family serine peptidase [Polyangiaceae bacterium]
MLTRQALSFAVSLAGLSALLSGCSGGSETTGDKSATGGADTGGGTATAPTGGATASGGASTGGSPSGGADTAGGTAPAPTGGATASGGPSTGGSADGGRDNTGGATPAATGGANTGGRSAAGGRSATGGSASGGAASGGETSTAPGTGGTPSTGGAESTGGSAGADTSPGCGAEPTLADCSTTTTGPCTMDVSGVTREYFLVLPDAYDPSTPYPLVFAWHGLGGTADMFLPSRFGIGGSGGFYGVRGGIPEGIYVTAQGLPSAEGETDYGWPNTNGRDVEFTKAMIDLIETNYCVDKKRLFSTGMSYGGMMSNTLGCQMPDVFRAIGVMSGSLFARGNSCSALPIAAWFTHGDADDVVDISGDVTARDMFIEHNGCDTAQTETVAMSDGITTCTIYRVCSAGNYPVVWCPVPGEGHAIPNWAGEEIAKFFLQF